MNEALSIRQALAKYNKIIQPIKGSSMLPMLDEDKDAVELVAVTGTLKKYDLPLFRRRNGQLVLHRVIAVKKNHYLICGDNSMEVEKVPRERILAVATGFYKDGRYVSCQDEGYLAYVQERWKDFSSREIIRKIPNDWKAVLSMYRMAITGREEEIKISNNLNWAAVYDHCKKQMIGATVYPILDKTVCPEQLKKKFARLNQQNLHRWLLFQAEREAIYQELERQSIPYMSLKGILLAPLYPALGMREMADNDVLIRSEDEQILGRYMADRGYKSKSGWIHISYHKKPFLNFEFHTSLTYDKRAEAGFSEVWERACRVKENGWEFKMSDEDVYLHAVAHFHKHYVRSGAGIRAFADVYLLRQQNKHYDTQYIQRKLEEMGLREFAEFFEKTAQQIFEGNIEEIPMDTLQYLFDSGAYGTVENRARNAIARKGAGKYFWSRVFLPYTYMCRDYPCLIKWPVLLQVFWVVRLVRSAFDSQKRRKMKIELSALTEKKNKKNG